MIHALFGYVFQPENIATITNINTYVLKSF